MGGSLACICGVDRFLEFVDDLVIFLVVGVCGGGEFFLAFDCVCGLTRCVVFFLYLMSGWFLYLSVLVVVVRVRGCAFE